MRRPAAVVDATVNAAQVLAAVAAGVTVLGAAFGGIRWLYRSSQRPRLESRFSIPAASEHGVDTVTVAARSFELVVDCGFRNVGSRQLHDPAVNLWVPRTVPVYWCSDSRGLPVPDLAPASAHSTDTLMTADGPVLIHFLVRRVGPAPRGTHIPNYVRLRGEIPRGASSITIPLRLLVLDDTLPPLDGGPVRGVGFALQLRVRLAARNSVTFSEFFGGRPGGLGPAPLRARS